MAERYATALITGGSTGIGAALTRALAKRGTRVAICGRRKEQLDHMQLELGDRVVAIQADVSDPVRAASVVDEAAERLGSLDLVIANAGMGKNRPAARLTPADVTDVLRLNVLGACATVTAAIPHMLRQKHGHIVGISSIAGARGLPTSAAYSASKAALSTFLESIRVDLHPHGIHVTDVRPGFVDTPLTQQNRFSMPFLLSADDAAERIMRAIGAGRRVYTFPFPMAVASRLLGLVPDWVYDRAGGRVGNRSHGGTA